MTDLRSAFDLITAALWFALSAVGIVLRTQRLLRLRRIRLIEPVDPRDAEYLASVIRSTRLRLGVKVVFLIGGSIALYDLTLLWPVWRIGVVLALLLMILETVSVDMIRERLGRAVEATP